MENNIHHINVSKLSPKQKHIVDVTTKHMENIKYEEIMELLKSIPEVHHANIEDAIQNRKFELLGVTIVMALFQISEDNITKALYP